ncbi:major facilitator superfamily transporter [Leptodontidium sp. MPI-SDFR-AT-0119]|nr:major facilitator superfamily transporter [Leptodontidium sp. MPI-SDFR-AT-0119]
MSSDTDRTISNRSKYESMDLSGSVYLVSGDGKIISLPMPSRSPRDPLNWGRNRRVLAFLPVLWYQIVCLVLVQATSSLFIGVQQKFSSEDMKPFGPGSMVSATSLFQRFGSFLWAPLSLAVGRRPAFVLATFVLTASTLWAALSNDFYQYLAALCLGAVAQGFALSASLLLIIDLAFIHERPQAVALNWALTPAAAYAIFSLAPEMSSDGTNYKRFYQIWVVPCFISIALALFFFPETYFIRPAQSYDGRILAQSATEKTEFYESWEAFPGGKHLPDAPDHPDHPELQRWWFMRYQYRLFVTTRAGWRGMFACYPQVILCLINPLILWVAVLQAIMLCSYISIGETIVVTLVSEPYNLTPTFVARGSAAIVPASLLTWPLCSYVLSLATKKLAMRNGGIREAEYYLPAFIIPVLAAVLSNILYGLAVQHIWDYAIIVIALALNAFAFYAIAIVATIWVTEAFPRWAAPAIVVVFGVSYITSIGMSYIVLAWIRSQGIQAMQMELALVIFVVGCIGGPFAFFGKGVRQRINGRWAASEAGALRPQACGQ